MPLERKNAVISKGKPMTLLGNEIRTGSRAPDFTVLDNDSQPVTLASFAGQTKILLSLPSLDTSVCDVEAREFSRRASELENTAILIVSVDLPSAQKRWCGAADVHNLVTVSDHRDTSFGLAYGVLIKELRWLCRASFVVTRADEVTYVEYLPELRLQPSYDAIMQAAKEAAAARL